MLCAPVQSGYYDCRVWPALDPGPMTGRIRQRFGARADVRTYMRRRMGLRSFMPNTAKRD